MILYALLALALLSLPVVLYLEGRRRRARWSDWNAALSVRAERTLDDMHHEMTDDVALLDIALLAAADAQQLGSTADALRLLDVGGRLVADHAPNMRRLLLGMAVLSRMVEAMAPVTPLRPRDYRLRPLAGLARFNRLLHHLLVTSGERFRFKVQILRVAFTVVLRYWTRFALAIRRDHPSDADDAWRHLEALRLDLHSLTDESLATFRALVLSLSRARP